MNRKLFLELLEKELICLDDESRRIARTVSPLVCRLIELDEKKIAILGEISEMVAADIDAARLRLTEVESQAEVARQP